jgi:hypothetical protein
MRGKHRPKAFKNRVLSKIFEPQGEEGPGKSIKFHNEELYDSYTAPHIMRVINQRE